MSKYRKYDVRYSGSDEFFSDDNLAWQPASPADYGIGPNENPADAGSRATHVAWQLEDVEVDTGDRGPSEARATDYGDSPAQPEPAFSPQHVPTPPWGNAPVPEPDSASLDRLVDLLADKLMKRLGG